MMKTAAHPGDVLKDKLDERGLSLSETACQVEEAKGRLSETVNGKRAVTGERIRGLPTVDAPHSIGASD